ncbi:hypothetical protein AB0B78_08100 [Streptomyces sp. NPDC040724]|uniref:hypothetical protein n=1 Tax=Streptomyces sp. NPDC040724 TaxID=3155612 RepID=UPI0033C90D34
MSRFSSNTSAHHLHQILQLVHSQPPVHASVIWQSVLGSDRGTAGFARKHAELVALLADTINDIQALPSQQRDRVMRYVPGWWNALVLPEHNWNADSSSSHVINQQSLDMLAATADLIAGNYSGTAAAPSGNNLDELRNQCEEWLILLRETPGSAVSENLTEALIAQVSHVIWLIENADMFGGARVASEANSIVGGLAQAGLTIPSNQPEQQGRWQKAVYGLVVALTLFTTGSEMATNAVEAGNGLVKEIAQTVQAVHQSE